MKIEQCLFVCGSEIFNGQRETWEAFSSSDPDCSWGSNNRSMVTRDFLLTAINELDANGIETVKHRLEALPHNVFIDLEN